jgi:alpha-tubulin suppressor-like RCC1 family protein
MSAANDDRTSVPPSTAFVAAVEGTDYHWVGSDSWHAIPPLERIYFSSEEEARAAGYQRCESTFDQLGEFEILGELGRGGTSVVYRARDRALGREVAIKVILSTFGTDAETMARFAQEARLLAGLRHPGIVSAFAVKRLQGGGFALVMEYVAGSTLREIVSEQGPLPADRVERIIRDVGEALAAAHRHGIVHRDVKPDNIFLEEETGRALLADFGIAMNLDNPSGLTVAGTAVGTPNYMSPEQIDGQRIDGRSDLYSLGLVGWEMLTGERPWEGESLYSVIYKQKHETLESLRVRRPDAPKRVLFALEGALAKAPDDRWADVGQFLQQLTDDSLSARWRQWSGSGFWNRRTAGQDGADAEGEETRVAAGAATVVFRRSDPIGEPTAVDDRSAALGAMAPMRVAASAESPRRRWLQAALVGGVAVLGIAAAAIGIREPTAVSGAGSGETTGGATPTASSPAIIQRSEPSGLGAASPPAAGELPLVGVWPGMPGGGGGGYDALTAGALAGDEALADGTIEEAEAEADEVVAVVTARTDEGADAADRPVDAVAESAATAEDAVAVTPAPEPPPPPALPPVNRNVSRIAAGGMHSCVIDSRGTLQCWGGNDRGQLGSGGGGRMETPIRVDAASGFESVDAGGFHTCALSSEGVALCWGDNRYGQLGSSGPQQSPPIRVAETRFSSLALGSAHTCGLARDGRVHCWGSNANGQLGTGSTSPSVTPAPIRLDGEAASLAAGWNHTCAIMRTGQVRCWGQNDRGQVGDGGSADRTTPVAIGGALRFRAITAGSAHTCGLTTAGQAYCWGQNSDGRVGDGGTTDRNRPTAVRSSERFVEISAGGRHTCARTAAGTVYCWGQNNYGQLGTGTTDEAWVPTRVTASIQFTAVRSSGSHTCAIGADDATYCWGYNIEGQVGDGSRTHRATPHRVDRLLSAAF